MVKYKKDSPVITPEFTHITFGKVCISKFRRFLQTKLKPAKSYTEKVKVNASEHF